MRHVYDGWRHYGADVRWLDRAEVSQRLGSSAYLAAWETVSAGHLNPYALAQGLARVAAGAGADAPHRRAGGSTHSSMEPAAGPARSNNPENDRPMSTERTHTADGHSTIQIRGARENNLDNVSLDIPKRRLTVFTGVSGSGKSSLVFGTIAAESRRLIDETYTAFLQSLMPSFARPAVDELRNLTATIVIDQERMGSNARSTVGTATDAHALLRIVFSRLGQPHAGSPSAFSFNNAAGMCPRCEGLGKIADIDPAQLVDMQRSLNQGAILAPNFQVDSWPWQIMARSGFVDPAMPLKDYSPRQWEDFLHKPATQITCDGKNFTYEGLVVRVRRLYLGKDRDSLTPHIRDFVDRAVTLRICEACDGRRLNPAVLASRIAGHNIAECSEMQIDDLLTFVHAIDSPTVTPLIAALSATLGSLIHMGLGYLSLSRESQTLSGGESQRVKMVRHLGSSLTDITYVFDEPTVGLHPHDIQRMNSLLLQLRDKGNTVLVVEHKPETIEIADHVVDLGPGSGADGGRICFAGDVPGLRQSSTLTGQLMSRRRRLRQQTRWARGHIAITDANLHNLKRVSVDIPLGVLTVVTGVAGSGKSSLIHGYLSQREGVVVADQSPLRGSRRSNPATYTGLLDGIRGAFAKATGASAALFSANSEGACPACNGFGLIYTDLQMLGEVATLCEQCQGKRFKPEVLVYELRGKDISEVLAMSVAQARDFFRGAPFGTTKTGPILDRLVDVGLGYVTLGQPLSTLSGGERQRLKLAMHLTEQARIYVMDEPTAGLHLADVQRLLELLDRIVDAGNTVIAIEHHQAVMAHADWLIDLGPGAGHDGGMIVFAGTPAGMVAGSDTLTAHHLRTYAGWTPDVAS